VCRARAVGRPGQGESLDPDDGPPVGDNVSQDAGVYAVDVGGVGPHRDGVADGFFDESHAPQVGDLVAQHREHVGVGVPAAHGYGCGPDAEGPGGTFGEGEMELGSGQCLGRRCCHAASSATSPPRSKWVASDSSTRPGVAPTSTTVLVSTQFQGHRAGACSASSSASSHTASRGGPSMSVTHTAIKIRNLISTTPRDVPTRSNSGFYDMRRSLSGGRSPLARGCPSQVGATIATSSVVIPNRGTVPPAASRSGTHSVCGLNSACGYSRGHSPKRAEQHCPD
jgi:hypothetical protein